MNASEQPTPPGARRDAFRRYLRYLGPYRVALGLVILAGVAKFLLPLIRARVAKVVMDGVILNSRHLADDQRVRLALWMAAILAGYAVIHALATYLRGLGTVKISTRVAFDLRQDLWRHLQRLSLGFHRSRPTGSILSRLMSDIGVAQEMVNGGIINVVMDSITALVVTLYLLTISWQLTLLTLAVLPFYGLLYRKLNPQIRQASHDVQEQTSVMSGVAVERLAGIAVVQSFAQEPAESQAFAAHADELRDRSVRRGRLNNTLNALSEIVIEASWGGVLVVGGMLAVTGGLSAGEVLEFLLVIGMLHLPIRRMSEINIVYQNSLAAIERVFAIFDVVPQVQDRSDARDQPPGMGGIEFDGVRFSYDSQRPVLSGLSFRVAPGEKVAIVGESGAGKSTLVTLIPRLYDVQDGAIRIDGLDARDYRLNRLRRSIGIVLQDPILFSGTMRENLRYGRKDAGDDEIIQAARAANAHQFISELPDGYETMIGERGMTLSGGQRQRISLARTILQNPRILILDEATSSLDSESENLITEALQRVMAGRTCLIIAHRLSTVVGADRILVLREGRLVEQGPHEELLRANGYYRRLFEQQFGPLSALMSQAEAGK